MNFSFLVVDSGSTKADWMHYPSEYLFFTRGFNPFYHDVKSIITELSKHEDEFKKFNKINSIYWYGSGCSNEKNKQIISEALSHFFPNTSIYVEHDLLGAARALLGNQKGIACILGTGSNSCLYDGKQIVHNIPSLGFFLGDEGSAAHISKNFLRAYFYQQLLPETSQTFSNEYALERTTFLNKLHQSAEPNLEVAQFTPFLSKYIHFPDIQRIVKDSFREFFINQASRYEGFYELPIAFTGSVAVAFQPILMEVLKEWNAHFYKTVKNPIHELYNYHLKNIHL